MSKSSVASTPKIPANQLPSKSAWAKGPPQTASPRSQSPAPSNSAPNPGTHSRRPSTLGQGIPIKDGVSIPRNVGTAKSGSVVSFGSIDDASAPISSSPAAAPAIKAPAEGVKSFGSVPATVAGSQINGKSSVSSSSKPASSQSSSLSSAPGTSTSTSSVSASAKSKVDVRKLFQNAPSSSSPSPSQSTSDTASPATRPASLPQQQPQPSPSNGPMGAPPFTPFVPMRPPPNSAVPGAPPTPRSPNYPRPQMAPNGNGPRPPNGVGVPPGPPMQPPMGSPRLAPHQHPGQPPAGQPPQMQPMAWGGYYQTYVPAPGMGPEQGAYMYPPWGYPMPHQQMPPPQHPQQHPPHPHHPSQQGGPHPMPMSPRVPPPQLQGGPPGTPTPSHASAVPHSPHPAPLSHSHSSSNSISGVSISSPPPTPSSASIPGSARLNTHAPPFAPRGGSKIVIKSPDTSEVINLEQFKKGGNHQSSSSVSSPAISTPPSGLSSPSRRAIPIVAPDSKKKREEEKKGESQAKAAAEKERKAKEEEEKKRKAKQEEEERIRKEKEEERIKKEKEEAIRKEKEEVERKEKEEAERKVKEEAERKAQQEAERKEKEEAERKAKEEAERKEKEEAERKAKEEDEEKQRLEEERLRKEEEERKAKEEQEQARLRKEEEAAAAAKAQAEEKELEATSLEEEREEGEIEESDKSANVQDEKAAETKSEEKKPLRIDTAPPEPLPKRRPGPLDLSSVAGKPNIPAPLPSALATARIIDDLRYVPYPEGVKSPKIELNLNAKDGKFRYDRDFLLQFMSICKEKPDNMPALDAIGLDVPPQPFPMIRSSSNRGSRASVIGRSASAMANTKPGASSAFNAMGNFGRPGDSTFTPASKLSSEERFLASNPGARAVSMSGVPSQFARPTMTRTPSAGGPGSQIHSGRTRSKRGEKRDNNKTPAVPAHQQHGYGSSAPGLAPFEPVAPLQMSENRWDRKALSNIDGDSPEVVDRKVKSLLNKLTMEKFDSISDQIISWANKSEKEKDGRTLIQVIRLVFEKATDEATWSEMYARLCRKMMEQISPKVQDDGIKNSEGKPIAGGHLFRKYLLNRCQEDFERGWVNKEATAAAAATKAMEDKAKASSASKEEEEVALYSDEYYAAQKAKRQGLGLIKFIGELFKLQMLTERIMHECVKKLLGNVENPEEEEIESLCKLLATVGQMLDTPKARAHMNVYFDRMKELTKSPNVNSRMQFMLQDIIELRERKWQQRNAVAAPTTIAKIHEAAAKEKAQAEKDASNYRTISMSRGGSRRGNERAENQPGPDGWTVTGNTPRAPPKAGDLSKFGQISKGGPMMFGPSSVFAGKKDTKRESLSRSNSSANMFQMLQNVEAAEVATKTSRPPSRKTSIDLGPGGAPEPAPQRKRLILQPRTKPIEADSANSPPQDSDSDSDEEVTDEPEQEMSEEEAEKKIKEDTKEFFGVRNLDEAEIYFEKLPSPHHHTLVRELVSFALESKETDAKLVGDFFQRASSKKLCSASAFEEGFLAIAEFLDDIAIDAPKATDYFAIMVPGADLSEEQRTNIASKSADNGDKLLKLLSS